MRILREKRKSVEPIYIRNKGGNNTLPNGDFKIGILEAWDRRERFTGGREVSLSVAQLYMPLMKFLSQKCLIYTRLVYITPKTIIPVTSHTLYAYTSTRIYVL